MLTLVLRRMQELGLISDASRAACTLSIRLDNILANVFDERGGHYYLRMAEVYDLRQEYLIAEDVARSAGRFVPQPKAFFKEGGLGCIVFEGVSFAAVTPRQLIHCQPNQRLGRELLAYLEHAAVTVRVRTDKPSVERLLADLQERYRPTEHADLFDAVIRATGIATLGEFDRQRQHGDFVPNNFGMRRNGLVIFDWEDFGKIDIPGFDLAVLAAATLDFNPQLLRELMLDGRGTGRNRNLPWLSAACTAAGIERDWLLRTLPFHLFAFMWLKDRYSKAIRLRVQHAVQGLV